MKYQNILKYFNAYLDHDYCPQTKSYVEMDDIHDSIIYNGVKLENTEFNYIIKAKQFAINRRNKTVRQMELLRKNPYRQSVKDDNFSIDNYGFTEIEKTLCAEKMAGLPAYKSRIPRRQYEKILESIKVKLLSHDITATKIRTKFRYLR